MNLEPNNSNAGVIYATATSSSGTPSVDTSSSAIGVGL